MTRNIPATQLARLGEVVAQQLGLHFPPERWADLKRGVDAAAAETGAENYLQDLLAGRGMESLARHVTVGETYFLRQIGSLQILAERIVPDWLATRSTSAKPFKIWSAGCATGEEPYSVAIMLKKWMDRLPQGSIEILATDVNTSSLRKARDGTYTNWSFRSTPHWVKQNCFTPTADGKWAIVPAIRRLVRFEQFNLMDDNFPPPAGGGGELDVIFCRNVLIYFTPEGRRKVIQQFHRCLKPDGWLVVSPAEMSQQLFSNFAQVSFGDVTLYRKPPPQLLATVTVAWNDPVKPTPLPAARRYTPLPQQLAPPPSYGQAFALYQQARYEEAGRMAAALLLLNQNDPQALLLLARIHANRGELTQALMLCDQAIAADKMGAPAHYLRAAILQEQNELPEAIASLHQAVYANPECIMGHFALGNLAWRQGKHKQSEKHFENVLLLLARYEPEDIVPESDGLSAARLRECIACTQTPELRAVGSPASRY